MTAHPVDIHVGKRLRLRRGILGMSQEELAKKIGVTFQQVQKYERGVNRIGSGRLYDIARELSSNVNFFFDEYEGEGAVGGFSESEQSAYGQMKYEDKEAVNLLRDFYRIKDADLRKQVLNLIKSMAPKD